jgi:hypothetical protein
MGLFDLIIPGRYNARLTTLADAIAQRSHEAVWDKVAVRLATMSATEARGYVRARSRLVIAGGVTRVMTTESWIQASSEPNLVGLAAESAVHLALTRHHRALEQGALLRRAA